MTRLNADAVSRLGPQVLTGAVATDCQTLLKNLARLRLGPPRSETAFAADGRRDLGQARAAICGHDRQTRRHALRRSQITVVTDRATAK